MKKPKMGKDGDNKGDIKEKPLKPHYFDCFSSSGLMSCITQLVFFCSLKLGYICLHGYIWGGLKVRKARFKFINQQKGLVGGN